MAKTKKETKNNQPFEQVSGDFLYDQFGLDQGITIKHIDDCNQYFIPYEL